MPDLPRLMELGYLVVGQNPEGETDCRLTDRGLRLLEKDAPGAWLTERIARRMSRLSAEAAA